MEIRAESADESYETYCDKIDAYAATLPNRTAALVLAYPPAIYGTARLSLTVLAKGDNDYIALRNLAWGNVQGFSWQMIRARYPSSQSPSVWMPLEWLNPPLQLGIEYRTTERYGGKPVYVKAINLGALPNASEKLVEYADGDTTTRTISCTGVMSSGAVIPGSTGSAAYPQHVIEIITNNTVVGVATHTDRSDSTAVLVVKYWRTSD